MDWKFVFILCLLTITAESSLAEKRGKNRKRLHPACAECLRIMPYENVEDSPPADGNENKAQSVPRRRTENLPPPCVACIKFIKNKRKRMTRFKINRNRFKKPEYPVISRPDFQYLLQSNVGKALAPDSRSDVHFHFHMLLKSDPGPLGTFDREKTPLPSSEKDESNSGKAQSSPGVTATDDETKQDVEETTQSNSDVTGTDEETTQASRETAQSSYKATAKDEETTQVSGETTQSSLEATATDEETTQVSGETAQSSYKATATDEETTLVSGETAQSSHGATETDEETTQVSGETTTQSSIKVSTTSDETTKVDSEHPNTAAVMALVAGLHVPAAGHLFHRKANVHYDYD